MKGYFIIEEIRISRNTLIKIIETALESGASLCWVLDYTMEDNILKLLTVEDRVYKVSMEDLVISLHSLRDILGYLITDNEFKISSKHYEEADLILQIATLGQLQYD